MTLRQWFTCKVLRLHSPALGTCFSHSAGFEMWTHCIHCGHRGSPVHVR